MKFTNEQLRNFALVCFSISTFVLSLTVLFLILNR
jgi:hypothetical protein